MSLALLLPAYCRFQAVPFEGIDKVQKLPDIEPPLCLLRKQWTLSLLEVGQRLIIFISQMMEIIQIIMLESSILCCGVLKQLSRKLQVKFVAVWLKNLRRDNDAYHP